MKTRNHTGCTIVYIWSQRCTHGSGAKGLDWLEQRCCVDGCVAFSLYFPWWFAGFIGKTDLERCKAESSRTLYHSFDLSLIKLSKETVNGKLGSCTRGMSSNFIPAQISSNFRVWFGKKEFVSSFANFRNQSRSSVLLACRQGIGFYSQFGRPLCETLFCLYLFI